MLGSGSGPGPGSGLGLEAHHNVEDVKEGIPQHPPLPGLGLGVGIGLGLGLGLEKSAYATRPVVPRYTVAFGESTLCAALGQAALRLRHVRRGCGTLQYDCMSTQATVPQHEVRLLP